MSLQVIFSTMVFGAFLLLGSLYSVSGLLLDDLSGDVSTLLSQTLDDVRNNQCGVLLDPIDTDTIKFYLYTPSCPDEPYLLETGNTQNLHDSPMNCSSPIKVIVHGWTASASSPRIEALRVAYLKVDYYNVIVVNWYPLSKKPYTAAVQIARVVAKLLGELLDFISATLHIPLSYFHIIGHSLGAQIAGLCTQHMSNLVGRITALDAAAPCFEYPTLVDASNRLDSSDALHVDAVHTAGGVIGFKQSIGHADIFPNGGVPSQPGCSDVDLSCSHGRALDFWTDSITYPNEFVGVKCECWNNYKNGQCTGNPTAIMGDQDSCSEGDYYLVTGSHSPYGKC